MVQVLEENQTQTSELIIARLREAMELPEDLALPNMIQDEAVRQLNEGITQELDSALLNMMEDNLVVTNQKSHQIASDLKTVTQNAYDSFMADPLCVI